MKLTPAEARLRVVMGIFAVLFGGTGLAMALLPGFVTDLLNGIAGWACPSLPPAPPTATGFWVSLSVAMMAMITWISISVCLDVRGRRELVPLLLLSKGVSSLLGLGHFLIGEPAYFVDLAVFLTDFPILLVGGILYWRAVPPSV